MNTFIRTTVGNNPLITYVSLGTMQMNTFIRTPVVLYQASRDAYHVGATLAVALLQRAIGSLTVQ